MKKQLEGLKNFKDKGQLPKFTVTDINGKTVSNVDLYAKVNVISTWASWNYDSQNAQRKLKRLERDYGSQLKFVSICLDADKKECRKNMDRDSIKWHNICDGRMWETPILEQLGLYFVPDNIITDSKAADAKYFAVFSNGEGPEEILRALGNGSFGSPVKLLVRSKGDTIYVSSK